jgi:hypothetical protein
LLVLIRRVSSRSLSDLIARSLVVRGHVLEGVERVATAATAHPALGLFQHLGGYTKRRLAVRALRKHAGHSNPLTHQANPGLLRGLIRHG